jgi:hypothetical protein
MQILYSCRHCSRFAAHRSYLKFSWRAFALFDPHLKEEGESKLGMQSFLQKQHRRKTHDGATIDISKREGCAAYAGCSDPRACLRSQDLLVDNVDNGEAEKSEREKRKYWHPPPVRRPKAPPESSYRTPSSVRDSGQHRQLATS